MTVGEALSLAHIAALDAEVLMGNVLQANRTYVMAHSGDELTEMQNQQFQSFVRRREGGEPVAYIIGEKEFFGRSFFVDERVLIPRPATEKLVEMALQFLENPRNSIQELDSEIIGVSKVLREESPKAIVDIGTGSGCIAITIACALEGRTEGIGATDYTYPSARPSWPRAKLIGVDSSEDALSVAKTNDVAWSTDIQWVHDDGIAFLQTVKEPFLVVSNPPYIPDGMELMTDVSEFEPHDALFAGPDGKDVLTPLMKACEEHPLCTGYVLEMREEQIS